MRYSISIQGMHCPGCKNLIQMLLDEHVQEVAVDVDKGTAEFTTEKGEPEVKQVLEQVFSELKEYTYSNLVGRK